MRNFEQIVDDMVRLHESKNDDYGNSFLENIEEYGLLVAEIRISDKFRRFKKLRKAGEAKVKSESMVDTLTDMAAYIIMTIEAIENGC